MEECPLQEKLPMSLNGFTLSNSKLLESFLELFAEGGKSYAAPFFIQNLFRNKKLEIRNKK